MSELPLLNAVGVSLRTRGFAGVMTGLAAEAIETPTIPIAFRYITS